MKNILDDLGETRIADWKTQLTETLPPEFQGSLPSIEEIEAELSRDLNNEAKQ